MDDNRIERQNCRYACLPAPAWLSVPSAVFVARLAERRFLPPAEETVLLPCYEEMLQLRAALGRLR
jgi:hypothetical protein